MDNNFKFGVLKAKTDIRDYKYNPAASISDDSLPEVFSLNPPPIKNQGAVSSCVAHVAAEIEEYFNKVQHNTEYPLSVGYIYGCRYNHTGEGMYLRDALKTLKNRGISTYYEFPYNKEVPEIIELFKSKENWTTDYPNKISSYFSISGSDKTKKIKKALITYGPVMVSVKWYNDFKVNEQDNCMSSSLSGDYGRHCILIYGWNQNGWLIQNSWGEAWGNGGRAVYPFEYPLSEVWGISDTIIDSNDISTGLNYFTDGFCKIINSIINFFKDLFKKFK